MDPKTFRARWRDMRRKAKAERLHRAQQERRDIEPPTLDPEMQRRIRADLAEMRRALSGEEEH